MHSGARRVIKPIIQTGLALESMDIWLPGKSILITLQHQAFVDLGMYDWQGKRIATLLKKQLSSGTHNVDLNATNWPTGLYCFRLGIDGLSRFQKFRMRK
jgi:hypothetical protein